MRIHHLLIMLGFLVLGLLPAVSGAQVSGVKIQGNNNGLSPVNKAYQYSSEEGRFQVMMPGGCAKVHQRLKGPEDSSDEQLADETVQVVLVSCDRFQQKGQGCSVTAIFNLTDGKGGPPGPPEVLRQVRKVLKQFGVQVRSQVPILRELPEGRKIEGLEVKAVAPSGSGEFWVRGLLSGPDVYLLVAWNEKGGLWDDPEYQDFFNSFLPTEN